MSTARGHKASRPLSDLSGLRSAFSIELTRTIVEEKVGLPITLDEDFYHPEIESEPELMQFAQLAWRLGEAAWHWGWDERQQTSASPQLKAEIADRVRSKSAALLATMTGPDGEMFESLCGGGLWAEAALEGATSGQQAVAEAMAGVEAIARWAEAMSKRETLRPRASSKRQPDIAFQNLIDRLAGIYWQFWCRNPGLSRPDQRTPAGPFFRFVSAVADELDLPKTDEALATAISRSSAVRGFHSMGK